MPDRRDESTRLRQLRGEAGLRQEDLAVMVGLSRSTIANLEAGRQGFTGDLRRRLAAALPGWADTSGAGAQVPPLTNASLVVTDLTIAYVFQEHRSPSEMIQVRNVKAVRAGPTRYVLAVGLTDEELILAETTVLWGGFIDEERLDTTGQTRYSINFGRQLRRGESHQFAMRTWIDRADSDTEIVLDVTRPTAAAHLHLAFHGRRGIRHAWTQTRTADTDIDTPPEPLPLAPDSSVTAHFYDLTPGYTYHLTWQW